MSSHDASVSVSLKGFEVEWSGVRWRTVERRMVERRGSGAERERSGVAVGAGGAQLECITAVDDMTVCTDIT